MGHDDEPREFIASAFQAWREDGLAAVVLRNYQQLPAHTGNDIDVLFDPRELSRAEALLLETADRFGFRLHNRAEYATLALYFHSPSGAQVHFDLFSGFTWRGLPYLDYRVMLAQRHSRELFHVPAPLHEHALTLLTGLFYSGKVKHRYRPGIAAAFTQEPAPATALLSWSVGEPLAKQLVQVVQQNNWETAHRLTPRFRRALLFRRFAHSPFASLAQTTRDFARLVRRFRHPPGLAVVLCGPDGCGKSTVGPLLASGLDRTFPQNKGLRIHWKPAIFSARRQQTRGPVTNPQGNPPRNTLVSCAFLGFHWLEFFLGWHLRIRPVLFKGGLVLIDRWYYDFFIDQRRYRLQLPTWLIRLGNALLPTPHLVCLLDAPTSVLRQRKQEVTIQETERQRHAYRQLMDRLPNTRTISAEQPPAEVARALVQAVLGASANRLRAR